jgi:hypothetical protein
VFPAPRLPPPAPPTSAVAPLQLHSPLFPCKCFARHGLLPRPLVLSVAVSVPLAALALLLVVVVVVAGRWRLVLRLLVGARSPSWPQGALAKCTRSY